jgi:diguanylate cyclase (GGDEF)-like protein/PAS domain S-box-containing protein
MRAPDASGPGAPDALVWDALPSAVLLLDRDGLAQHVNRAFTDLFDLARAAALGTGWRALLEPASCEALLARLAQGEPDFSLQLRQRRGADELPGWLDCAAHWYAGAAHYVCVLHDVSAGRRAELAARAKAEQFRLLADNVPVLIAYYEAATYRCLFANKQYARTFGRDERSILGLTFAEVIGKAAAAEIQPQVDRMLNERRAVSYERRMPDADGQTRWIQVDLLPHLGPDGAPLAAFVLISDISKFRRAEQAVRESEERLAKFMQASCEGIVFHKGGFITDVNPPLLALIGYTLEEMLGRRTLEFIAPEEVAKVAAVIASGQETSYDSVIVHKDGTRIPVEFIVRTMERGGERFRMTIVRDLRDREAARARIHHLAHHDALTGLPNRAAFIEHLEQLVHPASEHEPPLALLFIDLDHFKRVNDSLGHLAGDRLLQTVALRITGCLRETDLVARFGGDEFLVLLADASRRADVEDVARKLLATIEAPVDAEGRPISVSASIGVALCPDHGLTPAELIKHADAAMYLAKSRGRANVQFFDPGTASVAYSALVIEGELAQGLARGEFVLYFQPQLRARDGAFVGCEALIRWQHPRRGLLPPDEFIPVAEQRRLMLPIGRWALLQAARAAQSWRGGALADAPVAVNLSSMQFHASGFVETVTEVLRETGLDGRRLELELTERMLMSDLGPVRETLARLKALGIRISVDDFGTGYSSLGHLKELPIDKMKIDRSFVRDLPERDSAAIATAVIQMGHSLDITVIAEGVETAAQRDFLAAAGCDELQGDAIGPPMTSEALERWVAALEPRAASVSAASSAP